MAYCYTQNCWFLLLHSDEWCEPKYNYVNASVVAQNG